MKKMPLKNGKSSAAAAVEQPAPQSTECESESDRTDGAAGTTAAVLDPEVLERPKRRRFNAAYKIAILREADSSPGKVGALLRREGLYSSHLTNWRKQREAGELAGLAPLKRGRKGRERNPLDDKMLQLDRENRRLKKRLQRAEMIIDVQKKIAELLGIPQSQLESENG